MKFCGNILVVEHLETTGLHSSVIAIPEGSGPMTTTVQALVVGVGHTPKQKRKRGVYYCEDDLKVGDIVLVPKQLGSRNRIPFLSKAIVYDSEDVLAKVDFPST